MTSPTIIPFARRERLVKKARTFLDDPERFLSAPEKAVPALMRALPVADEDMKNAIIMMLGGVPANTVAWPLYHIMAHAAETEEIRFHAAIQLSLTLPGMTDTSEIGRQLEHDLSDRDPVVRRNAAVAYGWEGNARAASFLSELIRQGDPDNREDAVTALANLNTESAVLCLRRCFEDGSIDDRRVILYNLWRVTRHREAAIDMVVGALSDPDDVLRLDAMIVFCSLADPDRHQGVYLACLKDPLAAIRELSMRQLERLARELRRSVSASVAALGDDPHPPLRVMARRFLMSVCPSSER